jgi:4-amino-4-deoxy-L-arabinose transferase-like glycosyltransferase
VSTQRQLKVWGLLLVVLLDLAVGAFLAGQIVRLAPYPFDFDEALHATRGLTLALDIRQGELGAFLSDAYRQSVYPPGFAVFEALIFLLFGASTTTARLCSLLSLIGSTFLLYGLALEIDEAYGWLAGLVAVGLMLSAPWVLLHSALVMLELPGLMVTLATLLAYLRADRSTRSGWWVLTSLLMALTALVKYPSGLLVLGAIAGAEGLRWLLDRDQRDGSVPARRWAWLFLPFMALMGIWFAGSGKLSDFLYYATLQPKHADWYSLENLVFYPRSIVLHYLASPVLGLLLGAGLVWAGVRWRRHSVRPIVLYGVLGLAMMTLKQSNNPRFILPVVPAFYLLTGLAVARLAAGWRAAGTSRRRLWLATAALGIVLLASLPAAVESFAVLPDLLTVEVETDPRAHALAGWVADQVQGQPVYYVNTWDQFSALAIEWVLATEHGVTDCCPGFRSLPETYLDPFTPEAAAALAQEMRDHGAELLVVVEGGVGVRQIWPQYEAAYSGFLEPVAAREGELTFYQLGSWFKTSRVTRAGLAQAQAERRIDLTVRARVYRLLYAR